MRTPADNREVYCLDKYTQLFRRTLESNDHSLEETGSEGERGLLQSRTPPESHDGHLPCTLVDSYLSDSSYLRQPMKALLAAAGISKARDVSAARESSKGSNSSIVGELRWGRRVR